MDTQTLADTEFNAIQFEKRLTNLKDSQENINALCKWCLENRQHHKKIVTSWLNVLKRVKIEQRVNLFYLANDVVQYSKRKNYEYVESWGTALQKATTLVRDDKVKHKILRIFNIWEQRGVYNEEFISDLCGLISVVPTASKSDEPHEFQSTYLINKIKHCAKLENETDLKLKNLKEHNPRIQIDTESLCASLKERAHVDDVEKELEVYVQHLEGYINALKAEIKCRINNISVLKQAGVQLEKDKKDVKVVANAYRTFGTRVKTFQKKLEEHKTKLISPVPSPDVNAPSPSPDRDLDLPGDDNGNQNGQYTTTMSFYNPVPPPESAAAVPFVPNGFTSFIGTNNPFGLQNINTSTLFDDQTNSTASTSTVSVSYGQQQAPPSSGDNSSVDANSFQYPLQPPPMPPFSDTAYGVQTPTASTPNVYDTSTVVYPSQDDYGSGVYDTDAFNNSQLGYPDGSYGDGGGGEEYNPEQEPDTWEADASWVPSIDTDTPESPPLFEKESFNEPVEYHDTVITSGLADVDHRILHTDLGKPSRGRGKDVDHRNLISLTGSPSSDTTSTLAPPPPPPATELTWAQQGDQDYRQPLNRDRDYRVPPPFNIEQLKLPPPPPPPTNKNSSPKKSATIILQDNNESIDMDLSEDENLGGGVDRQQLEPPPPFPDLPEDVVDGNGGNSNQDYGEYSMEQYGTAPPPPPMPYMSNMPPPMMNSSGPPPPPPPPPGSHQASSNHWDASSKNYGTYRSGHGNFANGNSGRGLNGRGAWRGGGGGMYRAGGNAFRGRGFRGPNKNIRQRGNNRSNYKGF